MCMQPMARKTSISFFFRGIPAGVVVGHGLDGVRREDSGSCGYLIRQGERARARADGRGMGCRWWVRGWAARG